jgi:hypothetical protein
MADSRLQQLLNNGIFTTDNSVCCPSCGDLYVLSGLERFKTLAEYFNYQGFDECCLNFFGNIETELKFPEQISLTNCCNNDFDSCINRLNEILNFDQIQVVLGLGIVEYSLLGSSGNSQLCSLIDNIINQGLTNEQAYTAITTILDDGLIVYCDGCNTIISNIPTFIQWKEGQES